MRRESRAAHADNPRRLDAFENVLVRQRGKLVALVPTRRRRILAVVVDDNASLRGAGQRRPLFDTLYRAGTGADDVRGNKAVRLREYLPDFHRVPRLNNGLGGLSDVLRQRISHFPFSVVSAQ